MEGKNEIMSVLLLSLVLGQIQVEGTKVCCPSQEARGLYNRCRLPKEMCAYRSGCQIISGNTCAPGWDYDIIDNTGENAANEYCKLGCVSSVCGAIATLQNSDASEVVNGAVEKCTMTCSALCTKGFITAVETA